jgi:hypothetical protein
MVTLPVDRCDRRWRAALATVFWMLAVGSTIGFWLGRTPTTTPVTCVIPGHDRPGREVVVDELRIDAAPLGFEFSGNCGYEATFEYAS